MSGATKLLTILSVAALCGCSLDPAVIVDSRAIPEPIVWSRADQQSLLDARRRIREGAPLTGEDRAILQRATTEYVGLRQELRAARETATGSR